MTNLALTDPTTQEVRAVAVRRLLVAGFTGRDAASVREHVDELAALGVPVPERTPTLYRLDPALLAQTEVLVVDGADTSGEVEPVLVVVDGELWLTVGSDHTDRALERADIAASKAACGKVLGTTAVPLASLDQPDDVGLHSVVGEDREPYQDGTMGALRRVDDLLAHLAEHEDLRLEDGDVLFLGTVPVAGGIRPSPRFEAELRLGEGRPTLALAYRVVDVSGTGVPPMRKPEQEFTTVEAAPWRPVAGVPGQTERILAADEANGVVTRMLRFEPGTDTRELGVLRHDFWEEVYVLEGGLHDLTLDETFVAGTYACRPPGMPHGPWTSPDGCVTFEVRYPAT